MLLATPQGVKLRLTPAKRLLLATHYTKNSYFRIYILNFHVLRVSTNCSSLLRILLHLIYYILAVFLCTCVYDLYMPLLPLFASMCIAPLLSSLFPFLIHRILPAFYTLAQTLYGICNSTSYMF